MKQDHRSPKPILKGKKLFFFYSILTLWESGEEKKVLKNFKSKEIKQFLSRKDSSGVKVMCISTGKNKGCSNCKYELFVKNTKKNIGMSLLYHLRNAFAHNGISLTNNGNSVHIENIWKGTLNLKTTIPFKELKRLIETIRGQHNFMP